ncbi:MAG: hypothetical protein HPY50_16800 [Firmicutes bacterium]|nr:hypothetical protein [Bacillota bacterium]
MVVETIKLHPNDIKPNQQAVIKVEEGFHAGKYMSRVEEVNLNRIVMGAPISHNRIILLPRGQEIKVEMAIRGGLCRFGTPVRGQLNTPIPTIQVDWPEQVERIQRRNWVRIPLVADMTYSLLTEEPETAPLPVKSRSLDISGGGMLITTTQDKEALGNGLLSLTLKLPALELNSIKARVAHILTGVNKSTPNRVGVEFLDVPRMVREQIVKFINLKQREMIRMGQLQRSY